MKHIQLKLPVRKHSQSGFALVVTLSLMILLTIIAVGLLSLSAISLRASTQGSAIATARSNARMALMLAIGDLQKYAGPDQSVTARADVTDENIANPRLTGVWKSWDMEPTISSSDYQQVQNEKKTNGKFQGWLASSTYASGSKSTDFSFAGNKLDPKNTKTTATLWDEGSLGTSATAKDLIYATKVPTKPNKGAFAYAVMDEGVKARINTPYFDTYTKGAQTTLLGSGQRPKTTAIPGLENLEAGNFEFNSEGFDTIKKGITAMNLQHAADSIPGATGTGDSLKQLFHDVTSTSMGVFADVAKGGLKQDFHLLTMQPPYAVGDGVYDSLLDFSAPSDPRWGSFLEFANLYKDSSRLKTLSGAPMAVAQGPKGWSAAKSVGTTVTINPAPPTGTLLLPNITKVQLLFSLVGRDLYDKLPAAPIMRQLTKTEKATGIHGPQDAHFRDTRFDYDLHLMYTPIVTLHNPYNVALQFSNMEVNFLDVPFSMQVFRNGQPLSNGLVAVDAMRNDNQDGSRAKPFGMKLKASPNGSAVLTLLPGEVKIFSAYIDPNLTYTNRGSFWDIYLDQSKTANFEATAGWRGDGIGFDCDWLAGNKPVSTDKNMGHWSSCYGLAWNDQIHVEFAPQGRTSATKFVVQIKAKSGSTSAVVNAIEMDYKSNTGLTNILSATGQKFPMRYPKDPGSFKLGWELIDRASTPIKSLKYVKPFALLSVQGKTTSGGRDPNSDDDGRLATKPWSFGHPSIGASTQKIDTEHPAHLSHEISMQRLENGTLNFFQIDPQNRGFSVTGNTSVNGIKFASMYDIPIAPIQSLSSLNGANPGGSSGYLPRFAQPIGNSWAHPQLDPSVTSTSGGTYPYLDHSFLLNMALYDRFYFSGLADQSVGSFVTGKQTKQLVNDFILGKEPLTDPRMALYQPDGKATTELEGDTSSNDGYRKIAAWQMINGPFNINSTSVSAWKAMLGSMQGSNALFNQLNKSSSSVSSKLTNLSATDADENRISRFRLPSSESEKDGAEPSEAYWLGPREFTDAQLDVLAKEIVDQVRERGPFLSMAEFVNRQLGSDDKAQRGALQQAIDNSKLNDAAAASANAGWEIGEANVSAYAKNSKAGAGLSSQGAPGFLTQADLLNVLGNAATPRSDTFTIRGYGEARDGTDNPIATAVCEAVVQRVPEYVDSADKAETPTSALTSTTNQKFGRRFQIVSFRWLSAAEI